VSAGTASDVKTFVAAALLSLSAGLLIVLGYRFVGFFGGFLGIVVAGFAIWWWKNLHDKVFPRELPRSSMLGLFVVTVVLSGLVFLMAGSL
jgi:hypothetical protein